MVFLPGDHALDMNITVTNVASLTMVGKSSSGNRATVVCSGSVGFRFNGTVDLKIYSLAFKSCSRKYAAPPAILDNFALLLQTSQYAELVNCSFHDNIGTALAVNNTNITLAGNTEFTHNHCETNSCVGGGIVALSSNLTFTGNTTFLENIVHVFHGAGGAIYASPNTVVSFNGFSNFISNSAHYGGAIYTETSTVLFNGISNFITNSAEISGGAIYAIQNSVVSLNGTNNFISNSAGHSGGAIYTSRNTAFNFSGISNFKNNSAEFGGAFCAVENTVLSFNGTNNFISNSANYGGTFYTENLSGGALEVALCFNGTNNFISNSAYHSGGAIYALRNTVLSFNGIHKFISQSAEYCGGTIYTNKTLLTFNGISNFTNSSANIGGAFFTAENTVLSFNGINNFVNNSASYFGGAILTQENSSLSFSETSNFISNSAEALGGAICMYTSSNIVLHFSKFINNSAHSGGAIYARDNGAVTLNGTIYFTNNRGRKGTVYGLYDTCGGGVYMGIKSTFSILPSNTVYWENNHATLGGAIYVQDASPVSYCDSLMPKEKCFFQLPGQSLTNSADVQFVFKNNSADAAGSVLYGGAIDNCKLTDLDSYSSGEVFDMIVNIDSNDYNTTSVISSEPIGICPCQNNIPDCMNFIERQVYPGETFQVSVIALGQRNGTVPSTVSTIYLGTGDLPPSQYHQQVNNTCTKLNYTVHSLSQRVGIELHAESSPCSNYELLPTLTINLYQTCPPGFNISESRKSCVCVSRLAQYAHQCNITNNLGQITREAGQHFWAGYKNQSHEVILHPHCPFDYCVNDTVDFPLNNSDIQCAYNRSGLLCGRCKEGYSLVLGSTRCRKCTYSHLVLLIPFAVMGVALVFFLLVCKLTVATGMLSGLVFYANIVGPNRTIFLPVESTNTLSIFIAWLNLDFGIETCFFDGVDVYSKTWLQFVFPVYIWVLVGLMIAVSHFSHRFANLLGNNPVSVLATLILLSYMKILRTLITVLYVTDLEYPTHNRMVWLYDANINYLSGKHIPLFLVAVLVFLFLFLPYTFLLLFGQWLQTISHLRLFSWVNSSRLKPFTDSYHAPYKPKHRYWPGLLLVLRFVLLLVFALQFNPQQDRVSINLLAILVGTGVLVVLAWISCGVYKNWYLDALEGSFALNLVILVGATYYVKLAGGNQFAVGCTSVSIAFATFIVILVFQLVNVTGITLYLKKKCAAVASRNVHRVQAEVEPTWDNSSLPDRLINPGEYEPPFYTQHRDATAEPQEGEMVNDAQKRLYPAYTYGSIN